MFLSRILLIQELYPTKHTMYLLNRVVLGWGVAIIVISMFTEILIKAKENMKLSDEVSTQKIQMNNLKQEEELRNQFFANISHELRTPLNILICSFELLKANINDKDKLYDYYKKYDNTITDNSSRMLRLINNIIDASKFDSGLLKMNFVNCLSLVKFIVEAHDGEVYLNDKYDNGCEFVVILPKVKCNGSEESIDINKSIDKGLEQKVNIELSDIN